MDGKQIKHVVAGLIFFEGKLFAAQRNERDERYLKYEFPGGKLELGETSSEALIRELSEELSMDVTISHLFTHISHEYETFILEMDVLVAHALNSEFILHVHAGGDFFTKEEIAFLPFLAADQTIVSSVLNSNLF